MPPLPLDERIVVIQRPKSLALRVASPQTAPSQHANGAPRYDPHQSQPQHPLPQARIYPHPLNANTNANASGSSLECKRRSRSQKVRGERERGAGWENSNSGGVGHTPSHCHSNGTVTLGPRPHKHTHTIDIRLSLDKGARIGGSGGGGGSSSSGGNNHAQKGRSSSLSRGGSNRNSRGRKVSLQVDPVHAEKRNGSLKKVQNSHKPLQQNQQQQQPVSHHQNHLAVSPGGVLEFVPAQRQQQQSKSRKEREATGNSYSTSTGSRSDRAPISSGNKENTKLGPVHQTPNPHSLPRHHGSTPSPHATLLNSHYPPPPPPPPVQPPLPPHSRGAPTSSSAASSSAPFPQHSRPSRSRDHHHQHHRHPFPPSLTLHGLLPLSPTASSREGFPSPDHTCTIDLSHPFSCGCWKLVRCRGGRNSHSHGHGHNHAHGHHHSSGSPSSSFSRAHGGPGHHHHHHQGGSAGAAAAHGGAANMGLKTLGGCLSTGSTTTNTSSSNSTVSECRAGLLRPLGGCASCSSETAGGGGFESPAAFRKKLVGGCLPCAPLASSAPLRALQSCVSGCNPKASQTASSTCSYCSSDPIVVTFNPHRGKQQQPPLHGSGRGGGGGGGGFAGSSHDDDDYSVRTIWPEELAKKMTRSKAQGNHHHMGAGCSGGGHEQNGGHSSNPVILDCRNLLEFTRSQLTDHAGRRRLQQGKSAVLDFIGSGGSGSRDSGRDSLKRLWTTGGDVGMMGDSNGLDDEMSRSPSPRAPSSAPQSPPSFSPPPSAHGTLIKPKPRQRDREGGHSLPSAQSLHLVLNSLNQEQDEENGRGRALGKAV